MGKINILQPNVYNMLAAGEVVENPSSVVKELVENALDAGATQIDVAVEQGGIRKIQVSDNGAGILMDDMRTAFIPHATSKISAIDDLDTLSSLGFRGEALASIASVSEITLVSKSRQEATASKIVLSGGNVTFEGYDGRAEGTIITVENLFFNTPARLKFLKKPASEMRQVLDIMRTLVLANPSVSFTLSDEDGEVLVHDGGELIDAICSVYGVKTADKLLHINHKQDSLSVSGFVSLCDFTKPNRTYQTIIVNGRAIEDSMIQTAVEKAYGDYLMKRAYPMFVLDILLPFDEVDVNVHPRKTEVRFYDKHKVFSLVYHAVQNIINESMGKTSLGFDLSKNEGSEAASDINQQASDNTSNIQKSANNTTASSVSKDRSETVTQIRMDFSSLYTQGKVAPKNYGYASASGGFRESALDFSSLKQDELSEEKVWQNAENNSDLSDIKPTANVSDEAANDDIIHHMPAVAYENTPQNSFEEVSAISVFDGKIIGQIFATYLLVERDEKLYIIDQHAAHERILYDRIVEKCEAKYSQPLLIPYKLSLTGSEEEYIERIMPTLNSLGFEIENSGYVYLVKAVPEIVSDMNFTKFFGELFSNMLSENDITLAELIKDKLCQQACKAAIKGGEVLSREQIEHVIKNYVDDEGNLPAKCPHGRPAVIALDKRDFEKMFKRIV